MKSTDDSQPTVDDAFAAESRTMHHAIPMMTYETRCEARSQDVPDFVDMTDELRTAVSESGVRSGRAIVFAPGDSCSIMVNERESGLLQDLKAALGRLNATNGHRAGAVLGSSSVVLPIVEGRLRLGTWQRVLLVEFTEAGSRSLDIEIVGER